MYFSETFGRVFSLFTWNQRLIVKLCPFFSSCSDFTWNQNWQTCLKIYFLRILQLETLLFMIFCNFKGLNWNWNYIFRQFSNIYVHQSWFHVKSEKQKFTWNFHNVISVPFPSFFFFCPIFLIFSPPSSFSVPFLEFHFCQSHKFISLFPSFFSISRVFFDFTNFFFIFCRRIPTKKNILGCISQSTITKRSPTIPMRMNVSNFTNFHFHVLSRLANEIFTISRIFTVLFFVADEYITDVTINCRVQKDPKVSDHVMCSNMKNPETEVSTISRDFPKFPENSRIFPSLPKFPDFSFW